MTHLRLRAAFVVLALTATGLVSSTTGVTESQAVDTDNYIARAAEAAKASKAKFGVPRAVTIAQSILESGWGKSGLTTKYKNYFGIKCAALVSPYQKGCVALKSYEYVKGKKKLYVSRFRVYASMEKSFLDHGRLLDYNDRYNKAFKYPNDPDQFIREVHKAGYATDPHYAKSVIAVMKRYDLYRYDKGSTKPRPDPNKALITKLAPLAQRSEAATGVPSSVTIAQGLFHSSSGRSSVATKGKNYFAMVCGNVKSTVTKKCVTIGGTKYRKYASIADSVKDHGIVLSTRPRYAKAMKLTGNPKAFLTAVTKAGWSSGTKYNKSVYALITRYGLTRYDLLIGTTLKQGASGAKVTALQHLLANSGRKVGRTGYYGTDTVAAVKAVQKAKGLPVTGRADPLTLTRLTPDVNPGAKGQTVAAVKVLLKSRKYPVNSKASLTGATQKSVKALQKKYKLTQDGIVGERTWGVLFG